MTRPRLSDNPATMTPPEISLVRLTGIAPAEISAHMSDPRMRQHMPLLMSGWDAAAVHRFVTAKEECWTRDGLGHWAILADNTYAGWGGFQWEGDAWDFGLVLKPDCFGLGLRIARMAINFAVADPRIPFVTFLLSPSRRNLGALKRLGATFAGEVEHAGATFLMYRLDTQ